MRAFLAVVLLSALASPATAAEETTAVRFGRLIDGRGAWFRTRWSS